MKTKEQKDIKEKDKKNNKIKKICSNSKGITLIALIITVIILVILSVIIIDFAVDGKIFNMTSKLQEDITKMDNKNGIVETIKNQIRPEQIPIPEGETTNSDVPRNPDNSTPIIQSVTMLTKTTNSFTVKALATDVDGDNLTYKLFRSGSTEPVETKTAAENTEVQLNANDLAMYTDYTYYVVVEDGTTNTSSEENTVKTKCSGQTRTCTTTQCSGSGTTTCTKCRGTKKISCTNCGGDGETVCRYADGSHTRYHTTVVRGSIHPVGNETCNGDVEEVMYGCTECSYSYSESAICTVCGSHIYRAVVQNIIIMAQVVQLVVEVDE